MTALPNQRRSLLSGFGNAKPSTPGLLRGQGGGQDLPSILASKQPFGRAPYVQDVLRMRPNAAQNAEHRLHEQGAVQLAGCHADSHYCVRGGRERLSRRKAVKMCSAVAQNRGAAASFKLVEQALREDG
jgi:hypothetical protein